MVAQAIQRPGPSRQKDGLGQIHWEAHSSKHGVFKAEMDVCIHHDDPGRTTVAVLRSNGWLPHRPGSAILDMELRDKTLLAFVLATLIRTGAASQRTKFRRSRASNSLSLREDVVGQDMPTRRMYNTHITSPGGTAISRLFAGVQANRFSHLPLR